MLYVVSDIHGNFTKLMQALDEKGFKAPHKLLVLGDSFDRGTEIKEVYDFLKDLDNQGRLIYVRGNHDMMLEDLADWETTWRDIRFNVQHNGFGDTLDQLFGAEERLDKMSLMYLADPFLQKLTHSPMYYETKDTVYLHGGLAYLRPTWREDMGHNDLWTNTPEFLAKDLRGTFDGKTVVFGHWHTWRLKNGNIEHKRSHRPYYGDNCIGIDGCSNHPQGRVNVLVRKEN